MPDISVIIPTWNRAGLLQSALENLRQQTLSPAEIVVVDNGSVDETAEVAARFGSQHIALERNFGFAAAVNAGISAAGHEWILILNNDVELQPDWIERAIEAASQDCPDGVLLDVNLPDWDGFAVARALAAVCPAVRIVLTSADVEDVPAAQLARCQAAAFVPKDELAVVDLTRWFGPDGRCPQ